MAMLSIIFQPIYLLNKLYDLELHAVQFELFLDCICAAVAAFPHKGCKIKLPGSLGKAPSNVLKTNLFGFGQISKAISTTCCWICFFFSRRLKAEIWFLFQWWWYWSHWLIIESSVVKRTQLTIGAFISLQWFRKPCWHFQSANKRKKVK